MQATRDIPPTFVSFYNAAILGPYRDQPDKYSVETDYFEGEVATTDHYFEEHARSSGAEIISVRFGFRTMVGGDLALAVWMDDLRKSSPDEQAKWDGFSVGSESLATGQDARFEMWVERYMNGSFDVENGALARTKEHLRDLNALTFCTVGKLLFDEEDLPGLCFPAAQNNHRYHDAHSEAYKLLIDGLNKEALVALSQKLNIPLATPENNKTLKLLGELVESDVWGSISPAFAIISKNRSSAGHRSRPAAQRMDAFEQFNSDMTNIATSLGRLKDYLASKLRFTIDSCVRRREALSVLYPTFDPHRQVKPNYAIHEMKRVVGKRISCVEVGWRGCDPRIHNSELIILRFDDESSVAVHAGTNVRNLAENHAGLKPDDLNVSFIVNFVPPLEAPG